MTGILSKLLTDHDEDVVVKMISNSMLYYTLEEGGVEPNGELF